MSIRTEIDEREEARLFIEEMQVRIREMDADQNRADAYAFTPELFEEFRETEANLKGSECVNWKKEGF